MSGAGDQSEIEEEEIGGTIEKTGLPPLRMVLANTAGAAMGITLQPWRKALREYFDIVREKGD